MKIRSGFVSNSSTTSFVVAYKKAAVASGLCKELSLQDVMYHAESACISGCEETDVHGCTKERVIEQFSEGWLNEPSLQERQEYQATLKKIKGMPDDTWELLMFDLSYHDKVTRTILDIMKSEGDAQVLFEVNC